MIKLKKFLNTHLHMNKVTDFFKHIGPGIIVTVGFIDPGNWAANVVSGATFGYSLLWVVTLATIMLIFLQHNVAHIGIVSGKCLAEATHTYFKPALSNSILGTSFLATISTAFAEVLGGAIAIEMLFGIPIKIGAIMVACFVIAMLFSNSYKSIERWIIAFVSLIGISFIFELFIVNMDVPKTLVSLVVPSMPKGSMFLILSILGAVVMPHNLFLHSEIIQSREWNLKGKEDIEKQLKYEFMDTSLSMGIGWAINSAMIIVAAATFFSKGVNVTGLEQAHKMLIPMLGSIGSVASLLFAIALFFAAISASLTACISGGSIFSGIFGEPYNIKDIHTKLGIVITIVIAVIVVFFTTDTLNALVWSQIILSIQLPITVLTQIKLTSSKKVMGEYVNKGIEKYTLFIIAFIIIALNLFLLYSVFMK